MEIKFADSFGDSLKTMIRHNTWWYKTYDLFRYDLPRFFKNIWRFRKPLWNHYWFDYNGSLEFMETSYTNMVDNIEKRGNEIDKTRLKKVQAMRRAIEILKNCREDNYLAMAEKELGDLIFNDWEFEDVPDKPGFSQLVDNDTDEERVHNRKIFDRSNEIQEKEWSELFVILKGQDYTKFDKEIDWNEQFDGSGLRGWWD
jgi:hypothetical protein